MPRGIYKHKPRSEKTKKEISKRMRGNKHTLGKHWKQTEKTKRNMSEGQTKRFKENPVSEEERERLRLMSGNRKGKKGKRSGVYKKCKTCGKRFYLFPSKIRKGQGIFCSRYCRRHTEEEISKMSEGLKGRKRTEKSKQKMRKSLREKWNKIGRKEKRPRHNKWEYNYWKKKVFKRDNYTCQRCGVKGGHIEAHHLYSFSKYPELRFAIDNGITLCKNCHSEFHKRYGNRNNTKEQLVDFLKVKSKIK